MRIALDAAHRLIRSALCVAAVCSLAFPAAADDDFQLMERPAPFTDVIDAADGDDAFDFSVRVGFARNQYRGTISREVPSATGRGESVPYADFEYVRHSLLIGLDLGLFRDLQLSIDLPLVLTDERRLIPREGSAASLARSSAGPLIAGLGAGERFVAPLRSGLDRIDLALTWGALNQFRRPHSPTWVLRVGGSLSIGDVVSPCREGDQDCGVSDGTHAFFAETRLSRRYRYAEPYGGLSFRARFIGRAGRLFTPTGDLAGVPVNHPPLEFGFTVGVALVPWEHRGRQQRFTFDAFARGEWVSGGRDYTPLFDGLGRAAQPNADPAMDTSHPLLSAPNCEGVARPGTDDCTPGSQGYRQSPFTGITRVQSHGRFGGGIMLDLQAAQFVRFRVGATLVYTTPHGVSGELRCHEGATRDGASDARAAGCATGIGNPAHRPILDAPGNRFRRDGFFEVGLRAGAAVEF